MSDAKLKEIHDDVKEIRKIQTNMTGVLSKNTAIVEYTVKRTDELQEMVMDIKEKDLPPLKSHVERIRGGATLLFLVSTFTGLIYTIFRLSSS